MTIPERFHCMHELTVGVIGSGLMGHGIVQVLCLSNVVKRIYWKSGRGFDLSDSISDIKSNLDLLVRKNRVDANFASSSFDKILECRSLTDFCNCDVIHEVVSENADIKKAIIVDLGRVIEEKTIIASNTSSLSITELAYMTDNPSRVIGMHFFNPAPVMKLVEVVSGIATDSNVTDFTIQYAENLGKVPVKVEESPGFIVNRMLMPMLNEAVCILADKVADRDSIDQAMRLGANHPIGPLALADLIGNDVVLSIMEVLYKETGDQKYRPHPFLRKLVRAGRLGKKSGSGFYEYKTIMP